MSEYFAHPGSMARKIWGDGDVILLLFAGAAAEFALNKSVDWLSFTGALTKEPLTRVFNTIRFAQDIAFGDKEYAERRMDQINRIHAAVEKQRGMKIPDWAHRDVFYLVIDYSEKAYELLHGPLTPQEKDDLYEFSRRIGIGLLIDPVPETYADWRAHREKCLTEYLEYTVHTDALLDGFREELGWWRYQLLVQAQTLLVPDAVRDMLKLQPLPGIDYAPHLYRTLVRAGLRRIIQRVILPPARLAEVRSLDHPNETISGSRRKSGVPRPQHAVA